MASADHNSFHATPCDAADTVGGGVLGVTSGAATPPGFGWSVGSGQCNGSFAVTRDPAFPGLTNGIELGLRIEQRSVGQVTRNGANDYQVELGPDPTRPLADRTWWNFQHSIAYDGDIGALDALSFEIRTDVGPNLPAQAVTDMLAVRPIIDDRTNQPNPTVSYADLYQTSQNPEFGWFAPTADTDANPDGDFDDSVEGAWRLTLTAEKDGQSASVTICVHTPGATCLPDDYACYRVDERSKLPKGLQVALADQFVREDGVEVRRAREICAPTSKDHGGILNPDLHLVCYDVKAKRKADAEVEVTNQFATPEPQRLRVKNAADRLCIPSLKQVVAD